MKPSAWVLPTSTTSGESLEDSAATYVSLVSAQVFSSIVSVQPSFSASKVSLR